HGAVRQASKPRALMLYSVGLCGGDTSRTRPASAPKAHRPAGRPSGYDMAPDDFAAEMDPLWLQVKPLYDALHAFTRNGLERAYGARGAAPDGRTPAHLLGKMWSRDGLEAGHLYVVRDPLRRDRLQHLYLS